MDEATVTSLGYHRKTTPAVIELLDFKKEYSITEVDNRLAVEKRNEERWKGVYCFLISWRSCLMFKAQISVLVLTTL